MKGFRNAILGGSASVFAFVVLTLFVGCDDGSKQTGTQAPVDKVETEQHNKAMMEYMQGKSAKKAAPK